MNDSDAPAMRSSWTVVRPHRCAVACWSARTEARPARQAVSHGKALFLCNPIVSLHAPLWTNLELDVGGVYSRHASLDILHPRSRRIRYDPPSQHAPARNRACDIYAPVCTRTGLISTALANSLSCGVFDVLRAIPQKRSAHHPTFRNCRSSRLFSGTWAGFLEALEPTLC